eukprot:IDg3748t1
MTGKFAHDKRRKQQYLTLEQKSALLANIDKGINQGLMLSKYEISRRQLNSITRNRENILADATAGVSPKPKKQCVQRSKKLNGQTRIGISAAHYIFMEELSHKVSEYSLCNVYNGDETGYRIGHCDSRSYHVAVTTVMIHIT